MKDKYSIVWAVFYALFAGAALSSKEVFWFLFFLTVATIQLYIAGFFDEND